MSEQQYEIEQRIHDALAARDKRIEELCLEIRHLRKRAIVAEDRVKELERGLDYWLIDKEMVAAAQTGLPVKYDEPLYGDA